MPLLRALLDQSGRDERLQELGGRRLGEPRRGHHLVEGEGLVPVQQGGQPEPSAISRKAAYAARSAAVSLCSVQLM